MAESSIEGASKAEEFDRGLDDALKDIGRNGKHIPDSVSGIEEIKIDTPVQPLARIIEEEEKVPLDILEEGKVRYLEKKPREELVEGSEDPFAPPPPEEIRQWLPVKKDPNQKYSLWRVLREAIGRDLTRFAVPVYFNEPISMLQRLAEPMEHEHLLHTGS